MKQKHRGNIVEFAVKTSRFTHQEVAEKIGRDRRSLSSYYKKEDLSIEWVIKIGEVIGHDFSIELPELFPNMARENQSHYGKQNVTFSEMENEKASSVEWKQKYLDLLEKHTRTLAEYNALLKMENKNNVPKTSQSK